MDAQQMYEKIESEHPELHPILYHGIVTFSSEVDRITVISTPETRDYLNGLGFDSNPFPRRDFQATA